MVSSPHCVITACDHGLLSPVRTTANNIGIMFLNEVALGKEYHITMDDSSLTTAPKGYDCVVAKGRTEPGDCMESYNSEMSARRAVIVKWVHGEL